MSTLDPVILFFVLGAFSGIVKSNLRIPQSFYDTLSIYLLLSIGIKGGIELFKADKAAIVLPIMGTLVLGCLITYIAYSILRRVMRLDIDNTAAIAMHYGSVSAVTFAVVTSYLNSHNVPYNEYMTVLLVMLEVPAIAVALVIHKMATRDEAFNVKALVHEIVFGKSMLLLLGGLCIGMFIGVSGNKQLNFFFLDLFKGFLAIFMLEMGFVTSERFGDLRTVGVKLIAFGLLMPLLSAIIGALAGKALGLSEGGATVLATMAASASYIAAPTAARMAIPQANATYYLTTALGITFPFNITLGIPLYYYMVHLLFSVWH